MRRFSRLPSFEELEKKRLKAADLINGMSTRGEAMEPVATAAADAGKPAAESNLQIGAASKASLASEQAENDTEGDDEENGQDDADDSDDVDQSEDNETDESDENDADEDETDGTDDETDDSDEDESDEDESDEDESDEDESDENGSDEDDSDENGSDEDDGDETEDQDSDDDNESDDDESDDNDESEFSTNLTATTGNSGTGTAEFESETDDGSTEREFSLEVKGATTGASLVNGTQEVRVGGVLVGNINLTNGDGRLEFNTDADDDESPFPANFPTTVDATTTVAIGPNSAPILTGTFVTSSALKSSSLLGSEDAGGTQIPGPTSFLADSVPSHGLQQAESASLAASSLRVPNAAEANSVDLNLLNAGFAAAAQSDSTAHFVLQNDDLSKGSGENDSQILESAFDLLMEGDLDSPFL
jgi:hypothetical protein